MKLYNIVCSETKDGITTEKICFDRLISYFHTLKDLHKVCKKDSRCKVTEINGNGDSFDCVYSNGTIRTYSVVLA